MRGEKFTRAERRGPGVAESGFEEAAGQGLPRALDFGG